MEALRILCTRCMRPYARDVVRHLERFPAFEDLLPYDPDTEGLLLTRFADGEMEVEVRPSVRGQDVYLFAGCARGRDAIPLEESKIETYHAVDALRRAQARRITLFEPYVSAGRSDRTTRRNSVGLWVHFKTLIGLGVDHMVTYNLHSDSSVSMVDPTSCVMDNIPALKLLKEYIARTHICSRDALESTVRRQWVFCSVDAGGELLAKKFASSFGTEIVVAHKQRDYSRPNAVVSTSILSDSALRGKTAWVIDDILDTGRSVCRLVQELRKREIGKVNVAVVHAVLSPPALTSLGELHREGLLDAVVTTDTVPRSEAELALPGYIRVVPSTRLSAEIIHRLHRDEALSDLFDPFVADRFFSTGGA